ncbi:MAG: Gfo/Idh/MocA family oxidoreductase, partial [Planctomycetes bacterium]|nr:Gfo/Idh/MocA family oxidoreductase [Planctomycetota bacterium]
MPKPNVAVVGAGYWGRNHVRVFHQLGALAAVCDGDAKTRAQVESEYGVPTFANSEEMLASDIDAVVIATPASTHDGLTQQCLEAGKHVLVEKPASLNKDRLLANIVLAQSKGLTLMAGHLLLYHGAFQALLKAVKEGAIGRTLYAYGQRVNLGKVRTDEDVISSLAP